jgi:DNA-directed RNA polymerase subunit F
MIVLTKITEDMPISYDVETDYLYKKGIEKKNIDVICQLRQEGSSIEYIAKIVRLSPEQVRQILDNLKIK